MRHLLALGAAALTLSTAILTGGAAVAADRGGSAAVAAGRGGGAAVAAGRAGIVGDPPNPSPSAGASGQPRKPSLPPARAAKPKPPDFGPRERIVKAFRAGRLSLDDTVRYGLAALQSPDSVPAHLRPTGKIKNPQQYLMYLSALSATASPAASKSLTSSVAAPAVADSEDYDDCAAPDYSYLGNTYDCRAQAGEFLILFNIKNADHDGVPAKYNANGRATAVQDMLNALSLAADAYRAMGYTLPADPDNPYVLIYGVNSIGPLTITAPFTAPTGLNKRPMILVPADAQTKFDYLPRHELFHAVQYQYWNDVSGVSLDWMASFIGGDDFGSMNWWMEATAEWAAHQSYLREPFDPYGQSAEYARNAWIPLSHPDEALNEWGGLATGPQYGSFLFAEYATERTGPNFVRQTWEQIRDHDYKPIDAIWQVVGGTYTMELADLLRDYYIANYRLAKGQAGPPTDDWTRFGYQDPDVAKWRALIDGGTFTADDGLGGARPARTLHNLAAGSHFDLHDTVLPGGATYHDFWAVYHSGDKDCDYCSTLLVDTTKDADRRSALVVWSPSAGYPTIADVKYPDSGGLISLSGFKYPMVATLVSVRTHLDTSSQAAAGDQKTLDTYVETTAPLAERSCTLKAPVVQGVDVGVDPENLFNSYAASTPDGWTGGDSTYSVKLPDGRTVWLFSDTFLGPLNADGTRPTTAPIINNSFVVQNGSSLTTYQGGTAGAPAALMGPTSTTTWYWIGDGHMSGGKLQVVFQEYKRFGSGAWDWAFNRNVVADFDVSNLHVPTQVRDLPSASGVAWGSAILPSSSSGDGYTYVYGVDDSPINKQMRIARVKGDDLAGGTWQYYTPWGWSFREQNARNTLTGVANEYSVTPWAGQFLLFTQDSTQAFSGQIKGYTSCNPFGPFTNGQQIYRMPEPGPYGSYWDGDIIAYNAHVHAELSSGNTFVASYNVNTLDNSVSPSGDMYRDPGIYRPRFIRFTLG
ncbi:DUF6055 domain-containing protein [Actinoplanes subtropicus]|uniref:DUF6055 domain-containing protein n=1 Tax=Actinoplanes subtropicus TaxID=543632 RepID=UPI0004C2D83F|nr:DUF6055 domain-containing protein [Actinoplanes subtropicus]